MHPFDAAAHTAHRHATFRRDAERFRLVRRARRMRRGEADDVAVEAAPDIAATRLDARPKADRSVELPAA